MGANAQADARPVQIINVPLDLGAARRGTDAGPSAMRVAGLRHALNKLGHTTQTDIDVAVPAPESRPAPHRATSSTRFKPEILAVCKHLANETRAAMTRGETPLVVGGDHSIAMGSISGISTHLADRGERLGVVWFDAHGDMNLPSTSPTGNVHGMPLAHLLGLGDPDLAAIHAAGAKLDPRNVALIGIRDIDERERDLIKRSGIAAFTMRDIDQLGMAEVAKRALAIANAGTAGFHVSFDVDGCDPDVMPGSGTLVPGGVSLREAHLLLEECAADGRMRSMEVVELNPFLDHGNVSAERAVALVQSAFGRCIL